MFLVKYHHIHFHRWDGGLQLSAEPAHSVSPDVCERQVRDPPHGAGSVPAGVCQEGRVQGGEWFPLPHLLAGQPHR